MAVMLLDELADGQHILGTLDKGSRHEIHILLAAEDNILRILLGNRRKPQGHPRRGHALLRAHGAAVLDGGHDILALDLIHLQGNKTVGKQEGVARLHLCVEALVVHGYMGGITRLILIGQDELLTLFQLNLAIFELAQTHLRALGIQDKRNHLAGLLRSLAHGIDAAEMLGVIAVGEVEACAVHAVFNQGLENARLFRGRPLGADDFRLF